MIMLNEFGKTLRTGNFLFQYAGMLGLSKRYDTDICLPKISMFDYFEKQPNIYSNNITCDITIREKVIKYDISQWDEYKEDFNKRNVNLTLNSFLQSPKYWEDYKDYVVSFLKFKPNLIDTIRNKYAQSLSKKTIGISIRRGDFLRFNKIFYQIPINFYMDSVKLYFPNYENDYNLIFFSDDITWVKDTFKGSNIFYAEGNFIDGNYYNDPMEQLIYGSLCDNFVISNSTFSWWLAYYAVNMKNNNGKVIHCGQNLISNPNADPKDYYHSSWIYNKI